MIETLCEQTTDYNWFVSAITHQVKEKMGKGYTIRIYKVTKNNSLELDSLVVQKEGKNFAPNIYLMPYYDSYLEGTSVQEIADRLCSIYRQSAVPIVHENFTYTFEEMQSYIIYRLVSYERNKKLLSKIPYIRYMDLAITFHCLVRNDNEGIGTIRITNDHMEMWKVSKEEIDALAKENTKRLFPSSIRSMDDVIKGMLQEELINSGDNDSQEDLYDQFLSNHSTKEQHRMYILSNQKGINGASCMLYADILREFASQINSDFYILPSSIHEIILVPYEKDIRKETLTEMVKDVNRTQVARDEVLSDSVYYFSREKDSIIM